MRERGGKIVKRLGDGLMAVFPDTQAAVEAVIEARDRVEGLDVNGYRPQLRAGIHLGRPREIGGDYLGVDVNIAARLVEGASAGEILASDRVVSGLAEEKVQAKRRRWKAKGAPKDLEAYSLNPAR